MRNDQCVAMGLFNYSEGVFFYKGEQRNGVVIIIGSEDKKWCF